MTPTTLHRAISGETPAFGVMLSEFGTIGIARIAGSAGAEFLLFDQEHTGWTAADVRRLIAAARATSIPVLVRVPAMDRHLVATVLDSGAIGVMAPMIESAREARDLVAAARYPPVGRRGFGALYADQYIGPDVAETLEVTNRDVIVIAQVETAAGLEQVEAIAAVEGVDIVWLGQFDLTISLGIPGRFDHPVYLAAVDRVVAAATTCGKPVGIATSSREQSLIEQRRGIRIIAFDDIAVFEGALRTAIADSRISGESAPNPDDGRPS